MNAVDRIIPSGQVRMGPVAVARALGCDRRTALRRMVSGDIKSIARSCGERVFRVTTDVWLADYLRRENPELVK